MLRIVFPFLLVLACCFGSVAEDKAANTVNDLLSELVPKAKKVERIGVNNSGGVSPAVHVNANGVEYGSGQPNKAVNKLRSARDSILLPSQSVKAPAKQPVKGGDSADSFAGTSSRRAKPARLNTQSKPTAEPIAAPIGASPKFSSVLGNKAAPAKSARRGGGMTPERPKAPTMPSGARVASKPASVLAGATAAGTAKLQPIADPGFGARSPQPVATASQEEGIRSVAQAPTIRGSNQLSSPIELSPQIPFENINIDSSSLPTATVNTPAATRLRGTADATPAASRTMTKPTAVTTPAGSNDATFSATKTPQQDAAQSVIRTPANPSTQNQANIRTTPSKSNATADPFAGLRTRDPEPSSKTPAVARGGAVRNGESVLLSNRSPALVVKTHGKKTIRVGRVSTYYVTAINSGDLVAEDVVVSVNVPNWAELTRNHTSSGIVRIEPNSNGDNVMRWNIRNLQPKVEQRLRIDLIPRAARPIELGVTWNFKSVSAVAQIVVQEPKLQMTVVGPSDIQFGDTKLYTITVSNPGTGDAENVALTLLPINDGSGVPSSRDLGTIKAGSRRTIEVELTARQAGELSVRAKATADGNLQASSKQDVRVRRANLQIAAQGPTKRYAGTPARFTVKITNNGDATAHDVVAAAALPMAAKYVRSSNAGIYDEEKGRVKWNIGSLRPGAFQVVEVTAVLTGSGSNKLDVRAIGANKLQAAGNAVTLVESRADLKLTVEDPAGVISPGVEMTYEVKIVNRGTKAADNVNLVGFFSEGIEPIAIHGWRGDVEVGQVSMQTIPHIAPGQEIDIKVIAKATRPGNHVFRAELSTKVPLTKLAVEEWTVFHADDQQPVDVKQQAEKPTVSGVR